MSASMKLCRLLLLAQVAATGACKSKALRAAEETDVSPPAEWTDLSPHHSEDADVNDLRFNYLDWGGSGPPLVMLHGFGDNPHIFDDLGPLLRERFHVVAFARRGHGGTDLAPRGGAYDLRALTSDLRRFLDTLHIDRANLLGWGTAANEITRFATLAPDRVDKLVYLEGGYDWSDPAFLTELRRMLAATVPGAADMRSLDAYRAWYEDAWLGRVTWTQGLEAYLRDAVRVGPDGRVAPRMPDAVAQQLFSTLEGAPRDYTRVAAPVLALYATSFFPVDQPNPKHAQLARQFEDGVAGPFRRANMERVQRELRNVTVRQLEGTTHASIGVRDVDALASTITQFLLPPDVTGEEARDAAGGPSP